jgi:hypothetical protein
MSDEKYRKNEYFYFVNHGCKDVETTLRYFRITLYARAYLRSHLRCAVRLKTKVFLDKIISHKLLRNGHQQMSSTHSKGNAML